MNTEVQRMPGGALVEDEREIASLPEPALIGAIAKAELDQQITTAKAYPRSVKRFRDVCMEMACLNEEVAGECYYVLPARRGGDGKPIEGPSVRLAEIVQMAWGNCQSGARVVDEGKDFVTAQGIFFDLEHNVRVTMEVRRRITTKDGHRFGADMIGVTGNAACSIALRNAIFRGIPKAFWSDIYQRARKTAAGKTMTTVESRAAALKALTEVGATVPDILATLEVKGIEDIGLEQIILLRGYLTAIKEGAPVGEVFAPKEVIPPQTKARTSEPKSKGGAKKTTPPAAAADSTPVKTPETTGAKLPETTAYKAITLDQATLIYDHLEAEGIARTMFCAQFEIGEVTQLPADKYRGALLWIEEKSGG